MMYPPDFIKLVIANGKIFSVKIQNPDQLILNKCTIYKEKEATYM